MMKKGATDLYRSAAPFLYRLSVYIETKKKRRVKRMPMTVTTISFFVNLPHARVIMVYAIAPIAIPLDIE